MPIIAGRSSRSPLLVSAVVILALSACEFSQEPKTPFNAADYPAGSGWYCYDSYDNGDCDRSEAECVHKRHSNKHAESAGHRIGDEAKIAEVIGRLV
jgi:hypothetical protein